MAGKTKSATGKSVNTLEREAKASSTLSLKYIITNDESLRKTPDKYMLFKNLAAIYEKDLKDNLERTSFDLYEQYTDLVDTPAAWADFLQYKPVKDFIQRFFNEKAEQVANKQLANVDMKASDAIKVKQHVEATKVKEDNSNIVVMLLPQ